MTRWLARWLQVLAWIVLWAAWSAAAHIGSAGLGTPGLNAALAVAPLVLAVAVVLWQARRRWWSVPAAAAAVGVLVWLWPGVRHNVPLLYYLQHLGAHLALAALFGRTLFGQREALITRLARMGDGELSERKARYTRNVTIAWTVFFLANALVSTLLYAFAPIAVWSVHANVLTLPLVALMFGAEFAVRQFALPAHERPGLAESIRAYRRARSKARLGLS